MESSSIANRNTYIGVFLLTLSVLMTEILLTRIFSVIAYYHFAFMAISIVMFGMAVGSMLVFILPEYEDTSKLHNQLSYITLFFSISLILSFYKLAHDPFNFELTLHSILNGFLIYSIVSIPFIFAGISICLSLTKFSKQINSLYATDLVGAGAGCIMSIVALNFVSGPVAIELVAFLGTLSAVFFGRNSNLWWLKKINLFFLALFGLLVVSSPILDYFDAAPIRLIWVKNHEEEKSNYEKWNSFSRVSVTGNPYKFEKPFTQGLSSAYQLNQLVRGMHIVIDASADTYLMNYNNYPQEIDFLRYDITGFAHYLKQNANVLIVGVGGGRDVLTALAFKQHSVVGIELNPIIVNLLKNQYADFTGSLAKNPKVNLVNAEGRSYVANLKQKFDVIQISLIDTWAATAAGAYALSENALFTTQAWQNFIKHLTPEGILTVTRWYTPLNPAELYRLTALASKSLQDLGVTDTGKNIMIFTSAPSTYVPRRVYVGNVLVSPTPFSDEVIQAAEETANKLKFDILYTPKHHNNLIFSALASNNDVKGISDRVGFDVSAPSDDKPFFFEMLKFNKYIQDKLWIDTDKYNLNNNPYTSASRAISILALLLITVTVLTLSCIILPAFLKAQKGVLKNSTPLLIYFSSIGLGFMFIEISQLQRFVLFLGPPTYGLSVILFGLLVSSGLGSLFAYNYLNSRKQLILSQLMLLAMIGACGFFTTDVITYYQASILPVRIMVTLGIIFSIGFFMGSALPLGMQIASNYSSKLTPWLWGVNGATSILGSVLAMVVALSVGIQLTYWVGLLCYVMAFLAICYVSTRKASLA